MKTFEKTVMLSLAAFWACCLSLLLFEGFNQSLDHFDQSVYFKIRHILHLDPKLSPRLKIFAYDGVSSRAYNNPELPSERLVELIQMLSRFEPKVIILAKEFGFESSAFDGTLLTSEQKKLLATTVHIKERDKTAREIPSDVGLNAVHVRDNTEKSTSLLESHRVGKTEMITGFTSRLDGTISKIAFSEYDEQNRDVRPFVFDGTRIVPYMGFLSAEKMEISSGDFYINDHKIPFKKSGRVSIDFLHPNVFEDRVDAISFMIDHKDYSLKAFAKWEFHKGDIFYIDFSHYTGAERTFETPFGSMNGSFIVSSVINSTLSNRWIYDVENTVWFVILMTALALAIGSKRVDGIELNVGFMPVSDVSREKELFKRRKNLSWLPKKKEEIAQKIEKEREHIEKKELDKTLSGRFNLTVSSMLFIFVLFSYVGLSVSLFLLEFKIPFIYPLFVYAGTYYVIAVRNSFQHQLKAEISRERLSLGSEANLIMLPDSTTVEIENFVYQFCYIPYGEMAGDWILEWQTKNERAIFIGDVCGKGPGAAMSFAFIKGFLTNEQSKRSNELQPGEHGPQRTQIHEVFFKLHEKMVEVFKQRSNTTMAAIQFLPDNKIIFYYAGISGFWHKKIEGAKFLTGQGSVGTVGTQPFVGPRIVPVVLQKGEAVFYYTDGFAEGSRSARMMRDELKKMSTSGFEEIVEKVEEIGAKSEDESDGRSPDDKTLIHIKLKN